MNKTYRVSKGGPDREVERNAVDYGDGNVMVRYVDTGETAIVPKDEIVIRQDSDNGLADIVDQLTEDEATEVLLWLAGNRPAALREAFRNVQGRVHDLYNEAGRPHS